MFRKKQQNCVEVKVVTWDKDSHGLFDYESKSFNQKHYHIDTSCLLFQNQQDKELEWAQEENVREVGTLTRHTFLGKLSINHQIQQFAYDRPEQNMGGLEQYAPYLVVRSLKTEQGKQKGYPLKLGDAIKFGRLEYSVMEYRDDSRVHTSHLANSKLGVHNANQHFTGQCKFCLSEQQDQNNFLIAPCDCSGSCMLIHIGCLCAWIENKVHKQSHGIVDEYNFTKFECEICKVPYPEIVVRKGRERNLLNIEKPNAPYIILEAASNKKNLFLIRFDRPNNPVIKVGRGHECELRLPDISVSRIHAHMAYQHGRFVITDNSSKFGTLVKIHSRHLLSDERCAIQIGRTVLICVIKPVQSLKFRAKEGTQKTQSQIFTQKA